VDDAKVTVMDIVFSEPGPRHEGDEELTAAIQANGRVILAQDLDAHAATNLANRHRGGAGENLGQQTVPFGVEVLNEDERHARVRGQMLEQQCESLESAGGRPYPDDWKGPVRGAADKSRGSLLAIHCFGGRLPG